MVAVPVAKQAAYSATGTATNNYGFDGTWPSFTGRSQKNVITITFSSGVAQAPKFTDTYAYPNGQYATNVFNPSLSFYVENKTHYKVLLSTTEDFSSDVRYVAGSKTEWVNDETKQIYTSTVTGLNYSQATTYYWKVIASNGGKADDPTAEKVYSFTTKEISAAPDEIENATVVISEDVGEMVGIDGKVYGPFLANDVVILPNITAQILIDNNKASLVKY